MSSLKKSLLSDYDGQITDSPFTDYCLNTGFLNDAGYDSIPDNTASTRSSSRSNTNCDSFEQISIVGCQTENDLISSAYPGDPTGGVVGEQTEEGEEKILKEVDLDVYKRRFWILGLFSYEAFLAIAIWGTFGPILDSAKYAFGWKNGYIALLDGWGPISSIICMVPFNWATQKYGLRTGMLIATSLIVSSASLRCLPLGDTAFTYLVSVAAILNGMGTCLTMSLPAMLSSTWFPMHERATATAVGALATQLGGAGMYFSPLVVRTPNATHSQGDIKADIHVLMYIHCGLAAFGFLCTLVYFPEKPPKPPSLSSAVERINYFESVKLLVRSPQVMLVAVTYVFSMTIPLSWVSVINFSLECLGISQDQSMWISVMACTASPMMAFIVARATDYLYGYLKVSIIGLLFSSSCFFIWLVLMTEHVVASSLVQLFVAVVFAISLQYSTVPLLIELAVELAYPCPESVVGALLSLLMNSVDTCFFMLLMIPSQCFRWVSFVLVGCCSFTIIPLLFVKEVHRRSNLDQDLLESEDSDA